MARKERVLTALDEDQVTNYRRVSAGLYVMGIVGVMVSNYLAVSAFMAPAYGAMSTLFVAVVFDAWWGASSWSWIVVERRDWRTRASLFGGVFCATAIQAWIGYSQANELGVDMAFAGDGQNTYIVALMVLRHAILPIVGLACVHALGDDIAYLRRRGAVGADPAQATAGEQRLANVEQMVVVLAEKVERMGERLADEMARLAARPDPLPAFPAGYSYLTPGTDQNGPGYAGAIPPMVDHQAPQASAGESKAAKWAAVVEKCGPGLLLAEYAELSGVSRQTLGTWRAAAEAEARARKNGQPA